MKNNPQLTDMTLKQNKRYRICGGDYYFLYCKKVNNIIRIYEHIPDRDDDNYRNDDIWIDGEFTDIKLLWKNDYISSEKFCYVIVKESNGKGKIIELIKKQTILEKFQYNSFKGAAKRTIGDIGDDKEDLVIRFLNKKTKYFALFSVKEKFIFGPYNYNYIEEYQYGVELDNKTVVDNDGYVQDLSGYINEGPVFYNKEKDSYLFFIDEEGSVYFEPEQDEEDEDVLKVELENYIYTYNKKTEEFDRKQVYENDYDVDWSQYNDIAYEGYSRLELGLED